VRIIPILLAASLLNACSADTVTGPSGTRVVGTWVQREAVGGTLFVLHLNARGTTVTGTGTYTVEGGRSGTLTETGTISDGALHLAITYDSGAAAQFTGEQVSDSELSGGLHLGPAQSLTPSHLVTFNRRD
jgi:hypothetical protein